MVLSFESFTSLLRGLLVGFVLAIPVGPIALLCMRRTLERGVVFGFATGLGAAIADSMYGAVAAFGIAALSGFVHEYIIPIRLAGGFFMLLLAMRLVGKKIILTTKEANTGHKIGSFFSGLFLTATNPMTMFGFAAVFTSFGFGHAVHHADLAAFLVLGIGIGSALWWLTLTIGVVKLRYLLSERSLHWINLIAGGLLALFGIYAVGSVLVMVLHH